LLTIYSAQGILLSYELYLSTFLLGGFRMTEGDLLLKLREHILEKGKEKALEPEEELARRFGVTRGRVREAVMSLRLQGILESRPRIGTWIRPFDPVAAGMDLAFRFEVAGFDPADAWEARRVVETAILPLVVRRITPVQVSRLAALADQIDLARENPAEADAADCAFHLELLAACGNATLQAFGGVIGHLFRNGGRRQFWAAEHIAMANAEHRKLIEFLREENLSGALELLTAHLSRYKPE
jgi:GntR family transcriptional regulator, transcriptional repressor for pyruvate dehydrogenase complex